MIVGIVNLKTGNIQSVFNAVSYLGFTPVSIENPSDLKKCDRAILPGVGQFKSFMTQLNQLEFTSGDLDYFTKTLKKPILGICLGLQIMANEGNEGGQCKGLGWIDGKIELLIPDSRDCKVPHTGWNEVRIEKKTPLFEGIQSGTDFYFVHSYQFVPIHPEVVTARVNHGQSIVAAIQFENIFGTQFHPEKSQSAGLTVLKNFLQWEA